MTERNVGREIAIILGVTVLLGVGFGAYLWKSIERPEPLKLTPPSSEPSSLAAGADQNADELRGRAEAWGRHLAAGDHAAAHAALAAPLRAALTVEQLAAQVAANRYLAGAQSIAILRTTEQRVGTDPTSATLRGRGVLSSKAGAIEITLHFVREPDGLKIASVLIAGVPALQAVAPAPAPAK